MPCGHSRAIVRILTGCRAMNHDQVNFSHISSGLSLSEPALFFVTSRGSKFTSLRVVRRAEPGKKIIRTPFILVASKSSGVFVPSELIDIRKLPNSPNCTTLPEESSRSIAQFNESSTAFTSADESVEREQISLHNLLRSEVPDVLAIA